MRILLVIASLFFFDLFVIASLEGHQIQWGFLALSALAVVTLYFKWLISADDDKPFQLSGARVWMLTPAVVFALKLLVNSVYLQFISQPSHATQDYVSISGAFCFSMVFLGLAIGSALQISVTSPWAVVVVFFGLLFVASFLVFLFVLGLAVDDNWFDFQF